MTRRLLPLLLAGCAAEGPVLATFGGVAPLAAGVVRVSVPAGEVTRLVAEVDGPRADEALVLAVDAPTELLWDAAARAGDLDASTADGPWTFRLVVHVDGDPAHLADDVVAVVSTSSGRP